MSIATTNRTNITRGKAAFTLVEIMIVVAIIGLLAAIAIPNFVKARQTAQKNACISNLRQIDGAKETWALENRVGPEDPVVADGPTGVNSYIKGGQTPLCPAGGTYDYGTLNGKPTCTIPGHTI